MVIQLEASAADPRGCQKAASPKPNILNVQLPESNLGGAAVGSFFIIEFLFYFCGHIVGMKSTKVA